MPVVQCPNPTNCLDAEAPFSGNLSAEGPDIAKCFRYNFTPQSQSVCEFNLSLCSAFAAVGSDVGILCDPFGPPGGPNPPPPVIFSSAAQSCTVECNPGDFETYTVAPGTFVALSQAQADADAFAFACQLALMQCTGPVTTFTNTPQTCNFTCPNGQQGSFTTPADFFTALSQVEANSNAFLFACEVAALLCAGAPPVGTFPGAGTKREDPSVPLFANSTQSCDSVCPDGSIYTHEIAAGTYTAGSRAAANAIARSAACALANSFRFCLSDLPSFVCVGEFFFEALEADGGPATTFALAGGALPDGVVLTSNGFIQGVPSAPGTFNFIIRATNQENGNSTQRAYTMNAIEITPAFLPDGETGTSYSQALSAAGTVGSETWAITSGELPPGLVFNANSALISGTPTTEGFYPFTVSVTDGSGSCSKSYSITVATSALLDWNLLAWVPYLGPTFTQVAPAAGSAASGSASGNSANGTATSGTPIAPPSGDYTSYFAAIGSLTYTGPAQNAQSTLTFNVQDSGGGTVSSVTIIIQVDGNPVLVQDAYGPLNIGVDISPFVVPLSVGALIEVIVIIGCQNSEFLPTVQPSATGSWSVMNVP